MPANFLQKLMFVLNFTWKCKDLEQPKQLEGKKIRRFILSDFKTMKLKRITTQKLQQSRQCGIGVEKVNFTNRV